MSVKFNELPEWSFDEQEVSAGVYTVTGKDRAGRWVEMTGTDPDALLVKCKEAAAEMVRRDHAGRLAGTDM